MNFLIMKKKGLVKIIYPPSWKLMVKVTSVIPCLFLNLKENKNLKNIAFCTK